MRLETSCTGHPLASVVKLRKIIVLFCLWNGPSRIDTAVKVRVGLAYCRKHWDPSTKGCRDSKLYSLSNHSLPEISMMRVVPSCDRYSSSSQPHHKILFHRWHETFTHCRCLFQYSKLVSLSSDNQVCSLVCSASRVVRMRDYSATVQNFKLPMGLFSSKFLFHFQFPQWNLNEDE